MGGKDATSGGLKYLIGRFSVDLSELKSEQRLERGEASRFTARGKDHYCQGSGMVECVRCLRNKSREAGMREGEIRKS